MDDNMALILRWITLVLSTLGLLWLSVRSGMRWHDYPYTIRLFLLSLIFFVFASVYGTAEAIASDVEPGLRVVVYLMAAVSLLVTLALTQKRREVHFGPADMGGGPIG
jgi:uncharacterized membrane protein YhaH (DUF805 family)